VFGFLAGTIRISRAASRTVEPTEQCRTTIAFGGTGTKKLRRPRSPFTDSAEAGDYAPPVVAGVLDLFSLALDEADSMVFKPCKRNPYITFDFARSRSPWPSFPASRHLGRSSWSGAGRLSPKKKRKKRTTTHRRCSRRLERSTRHVPVYDFTINPL